MEPHLISLNDACKLTSLSRTTLNNFRADGKFPVPVVFGKRRVAFVRAEVLQWLECRIRERSGRDRAASRTD